MYSLLQTTQFALCCQDGSFRQLNADRPESANHHPTYRSPSPDIYISSHFPVYLHRYKSSLLQQREPTMKWE